MRKGMWFIASLLALLSVGEAIAAGPFAASRRQQRAVERAEKAERTHDARVPSSLPSGRTSSASRDYERYPKFQGGFHSRELQNLGVPTGDTGLRGNGFSMYPW